MIKIHKTELFKGFFLYEAVLVALPIAIICLAIFSLRIYDKISWFISTENSDFYFIYFFFTMLTLINIMSLYFIPPALIASQLFHALIYGIFPKSRAAWILTAAIYSLTAVLFSIMVSLYKPSQKQNKTTRGYIINPISKNQPPPQHDMP